MHPLRRLSLVALNPSPYSIFLRALSVNAPYRLSPRPSLLDSRYSTPTPTQERKMVLTRRSTSNAAAVGVGAGVGKEAEAGPSRQSERAGGRPRKKVKVEVEEGAVFGEAVEELVEGDFAPSSGSRTKAKTTRKRRVVKAEDSSVSIDINEEEEHDTQRILLDPKPPKSSKAKAKATPKPKGKTEAKPKPKAYDPTTFLPRASSPWKVGAHVSAAGGVENAVVNAAMIGANAFALFLKPQRTWASSPLSASSVALFKERMHELKYEAKHVLPHGSYLVNLGNPDGEKRKKSYECFVDDLRRCEALGLRYYNFHPGSTVGQTTRESSIRLIGECLNAAHKATEGVVTVIENMAGAGNVIGATFEDIRDIIGWVEDKTRVGVCFDTCHAYAAGYDISTQAGWEETMKTFDEVVGMKYLVGMHLNDSKTGCGSKRDRHENLGMGTLGLPAFRAILTDPRTRDIPLILETPSFEAPREVWGVEVGVANALSNLGSGTGSLSSATKEGETSSDSDPGSLPSPTKEMRSLSSATKATGTLSDPLGAEAAGPSELGGRLEVGEAGEGRVQVWQVGRGLGSGRSVEELAEEVRRAVGKASLEAGKAKAKKGAKNVGNRKRKRCGKKDDENDADEGEEEGGDDE